MTRRYMSTGNAKPFASSRYKYESNPFAKFERPAGDPPLWKAVLLLSCIALIGTFAAAAIGG